MPARFGYGRDIERYAIAGGVLRFVSHGMNLTPKSDTLLLTLVRERPLSWLKPKTPQATKGDDFVTWIGRVK
jgi:hypothetical protein